MGSNAVKMSKNNATPAPGQGPHFVWTLLAEAYFPASTEASPASSGDKAPFSAFWSACVDSALFGSSSLPLKALGFSLIQLFLPRLARTAPPAEVSAMFGPNTLRVLANHLRKDAQAGGEKTLSRVAEKTVSATLPNFLAAVSAAGNAQASQVGVAVVKALVSPPHSQYNAFEPKVLDRTVAKLPLSAVKGWVAHLRTIVLVPTVVEAGEEVDAADEEVLPGADAASDREKRIASQRTWAFDQLLTVVRSGLVPKDDELVSSLLEFLAVIGWFDVTKSGSKGARSYAVANGDAPLTPAQRLAARSRFFSCLTALVGGSVAAPLGGPNWLQRALALLDNLAADQKHFARASVDDDEAGAADEADEEEADAAGEGKARVERVRALAAALDALATKAVSADDAARARAKTARALLEGVRLVCWDEGAADALDVLEGSIDAVEALFPELASAKDAAAADDDEEEDEEKPEPGTILLDVLLALLRRPSAFVKAFAGPIVLRGFAAEFGQQAIELLGDVVAPLDEIEDEAVEEKKEGAGAANGKAAEDDSDDDSDDSSDSDGDDDDDESEAGGGFEVDEAFKNELLAALEAGGMGVPNAASDSEDEEMQASGEGDDEEDEEELLDDEAMLALDDRLADIFRANGGARRSKKRESALARAGDRSPLMLTDVLVPRRRPPGRPALPPPLPRLARHSRACAALFSVPHPALRPALQPYPHRLFFARDRAADQGGQAAAVHRPAAEGQGRSGRLGGVARVGADRARGARAPASGGPVCRRRDARAALCPDRRRARQGRRRAVARRVCRRDPRRGCAHVQRQLDAVPDEQERQDALPAVADARGGEADSGGRVAHVWGCRADCGRGRRCREGECVPEDAGVRGGAHSSVFLRWRSKLSLWRLSVDQFA